VLKTRVVTCIAVLLCVAPAAAQYDDLPAFVERGMDLWHTPGAAVAVVSDEEVFVMQGMGVTSVDAPVPVDEHTLFAIASTTKAMATFGVLMLADEGKLNLDDPVTKYITELQFVDDTMNREITIRDLLAHRTGLPSTDWWEFAHDMPLDEQIWRLRFVEREAPSRSRLIYQNTMFSLLSVLIERVDGRPWHEFIAEELWGPVGMRETFSSRADIPEGSVHVWPHFYLGGKASVVEWDLQPGFRDPAGSVWSSVHDMALWAQFLLRGGVTADGQRLLSTERFSEMFEPTQLASPSDFYPTVELTRPHWRTYGLGWFQQDFQGRAIDFHTGSLGGLIAIIGLDRAARRAVIMLGNRDHAEFRHAVLWEVMDTGPEARDWNQEVFDLYGHLQAAQAEQREALHASRRKGTRTSLPLGDFAGRYASNAFGEVEVSVDGKDLVAQTARHELRFSHWHDNVFLWKFEQWDFESLVEFRIGNDGVVQALEMLGQRLERVAGD